jgi:2'-5' RNA ligase
VEAVGRIFVALGFPPEVRMAIDEKTAPLPLPGSVVPPENLHLTFRFLGETDRISLERLLAALDDSVLPPSFVIRLGALGAFPHGRRASVLWLDVSDRAGRLGELHAAVEDACEAAGFGPEERPFRPHVTLSRMRPPADVRALIAQTPSFDLTSPVDGVAVLRSRRGGGPPQYEMLERFPLGGSGLE